MKKLIYFDNNATTKVDSQVVETMLPFFTEAYANAASSHDFGASISHSVKNARNQVASFIGANPNEIIFTSGATEAINLAIKGIADIYFSKGRHIITVQTEHNAVLDVCKYLEGKGFEITYLPVGNDGLLDINTLENTIRKDTILVSVMYVNNEIGVIQPIKDIADITHINGSLFMTDATQAIGKIRLDVEELGIDLMTFSAHKFYGPKGVGGLYSNKSKVKLAPLLHGGGQEGGLRSGTLNVQGIVGLGKACEIADNHLNENERNIRHLRNYFEQELLKIGDIFVNGNLNKRLFNISNLCFSGIDSEYFKSKLRGVAFSNGSACTSNLMQTSHVLTALGLTKKEAASSFRFSFGKYNTLEEVKYVVSEIKNTVLKQIHQNISK